MIAGQKCTRILLLATILGVSGFLPAQPAGPLRGAAAGIPSLSRAKAAQVVSYPRDVLLLRHAEKPDEKGDKHLTSRGAARAAALPSLFFIPNAFRTKPAPFPTPDYVFATSESKNSNRCVETLQPLAKALGDLAIHSKYANADYQALVDHLFGDGKHAGKTVLICWHHGKLPELTQAVLAKAKNAAKVKEQIPTHWEDNVFDRVWQFTFDDQGNAAFRDRPQNLLFKDQEK
jgi:hypothetical protein